MPWLPATRYVYGGTGHLINDGTHTYQYDAEGRLISVDNGSTATYLYDALGQRVEKDVGGTYSEYVFNLQGQPVGINNRTNWHEDYIPMGQGRHVAHYAAGAHFMRPDALGTTGIVTSYTGAVEQDELHYPWGQQWTMMGSMKEERYARLQHRDCETSTLPGCATGGLDPTLFRTYSSDQGRWMTPDPASEASASPLSPQSFDRYGYVLGNPTRNFDAYGLQCAGGDSSFASPFPGAIQVNVSAPCPPSNNGLLQLLWAANGASVGAATALMGNYMVGVSNYEAYGGAGPGGVYDAPQNLYPSAPPQISCMGNGRGLSGNTALVGMQGGIPGQTVQIGTAAVIPQQFGVPTGAALAPYANNIWGTVGRAPFSAVTDVIGGRSPIPGVPVRTALPQLFPGQLILEIPGAADQGANAPVTISVPQTLGCPAGTSLAGGG